MLEESEMATLGYSKNQLIGVLDTASEGIACLDLRGKCVFANASCLKFLGYDRRSDLLGENLHNLIHSKRRDGTPCHSKDCQISNTFKQPRPFHDDSQVFWKKNDTCFDVEYHCKPLTNDDGESVGVVVTFTDISDRKSDEFNRNKLSQLIASSSDAIICKNCDGVITSWNKGASQIYGFSEDEALGHTSSLFQLKEQAEHDRKIEEVVRRGGEVKRRETKRRRSNGEHCDISTIVFPIRDHSGAVVGSASIDRDISDKKRVHSELLKAKSVAENAESLANSANRSRAQFLANISHELRTPMNAILGMIQLALDEKLDPTVEDYLQTAKSSADSLLELVNELLDFSKLEAGKFEINPEPFNLPEIIDSTAKTLSGSAGEKGVELFCEIDSGIPSTLVGDPRRIQQVITNLLSNAIKFTDQGEIIIKVQRTDSSENDSSAQGSAKQRVGLRFSVSDTGIGIKEKDRRRIFSPFAQADMSSTREHFGTGLGLSICQDLLSLMNSQLELKSQVGLGSTFSFEVEFDISDEKSTKDFPNDLINNRQVLIVDDNPTNLRILETIFTNWSMQPITATSGQQAIEILRQKQDTDCPVPLLLTDAMMPGMDGFELVDRIVENEAIDLPATIIMHSPAELPIFSDRKKESPAKAYVTKPISQSELMDTVIESLDLYVQTFDFKEHTGPEELPVKPLNILLVDDLEANRKVATAILNKRGHHVCTANNGRVALEVLQSSEKQFDIVLMDIQMPIMDGLQATAAIRDLDCQKRSTTPIIAMTAHALDGDREECLAAGMDSYISKPLDAQKLVWLTETTKHNPLQVQLNANRKNKFYKNGAKLSATSNDNPEKLVDVDSALKRLGGDQELFKEFVTIFLEDAPGMMEGLKDGIRESDATMVEKKSHALKGLISNFGAKTCVDVALKLERAGREGDLSKSPKDFEQLQTLYQTLTNELKEHA